MGMKANRTEETTLTPFLRREKVSVIVPCRNEEGTIGLLLQALLAQTWPAEEMEVVLADGMSEDGTRAEVERFMTAHPRLEVRIVDNPRRNIPAALNIALAAARHPYIVRLDAHCVPQPDYVERSIVALQAGLAENVGGVWDIQPRNPSWQARSIAAAAANPVGVGDALYRFTREPAYVDTVPFGAFRTDYLRELGGYDETLLSNEDYELNQRIRLGGGRIWLDPAIRSVYYARPTLRSLAVQYLRYGRWKARMLLRYPKTLRWRQALPPLFVAGLVLLAIAALFLPLARFLLLITLVLYSSALAAAAVPQALRLRDAGLVPGIMAAIATMHSMWGVGFWLGLARK